MPRWQFEWLPLPASLIIKPEMIAGVPWAKSRLRMVVLANRNSHVDNQSGYDRNQNEGQEHDRIHHNRKTKRQLAHWHKIAGKQQSFPRALYCLDLAAKSMATTTRKSDTGSRQDKEVIQKKLLGHNMSALGWHIVAICSKQGLISIQIW